MLATVALVRIGSTRRKFAGKTLAFGVTYAAYALATASRLPYSITKLALRPDHPSAPTPGWSPFTDGDGQVLLGMIDTMYMACYAGAMPFMGAMVDRTNASRCLSVALFLIGTMLIFAGLAHTLDIHAYGYFASTAIFGGCAQAIAFPCVIKILSVWFGKKHIGLVLGIWSTSTPVGTIFGKLGATRALESGWQFAFIMPGAVAIVGSAIVIAFLVADPYDVQLLRPGDAAGSPTDSNAALLDDDAIARRRSVEVLNEVPVSIRTILQIPDMIAYCCACFCSKLSYYALLFWLPLYLHQAFGYSQTEAGNMSTAFDLGGFVGTIVGGYLSDRLGLRGVVLLAIQASAVPTILLYSGFGQTHEHDYFTNKAALFVLGITVTTPYSLVTSVTCVTLGRHPSLNGNSKACGTVTAVLDGAGSAGAAMPGLMMGWISSTLGWTAAFQSLAFFSALSSACFLCPAWAEVRACAAKRASHASLSVRI